MSKLKAKLAALDGNDKFKRLLVGVPETKGVKSGYMTLKPGESVGLHNTGDKEETIIFLEGKAQVYLAGEPKFSVREKQVLYVPPHTGHDIKNIGRKKLRYVYVVSPVENTKS
jgi:mannose-6-phosphate isomerase-like protein (cupin superfamily)